MRNKTVLKLVLSALFITLSIILTRFFVIPQGPTWFRLSLGSVPIIIGSLLLGPVYGGLIGIGADLFGALLFPSGTFLVFPLISSALLGILPYLFMKLIHLIKVKYSLIIVNILFAVAYGFLLYFIWTSESITSLFTKEDIVLNLNNRIIYTVVSFLIIAILVISIILISHFMKKRNDERITLTYEIAVTIFLSELVIDLLYSPIWKTYMSGMSYFVVLGFQIMIFIVLLPLKTLLTNLVMYAFNKSGLTFNNKETNSTK